MRDILEEIVARKRIEVEAAKRIKSLSELSHEADAYISSGTHVPIPMSESLASSPSGIIAEFKRRSPSKGWIKEDGQPELIPPSYATNGASALSILTDEHYFGGRKEFVLTARPLVGSVPILRKDFIIDEYQLLEARTIGSDAVLLIASALSLNECQTLATTAHDLGLQTLLEIHTEKELDYVSENIDMVGVNNRHLGTFHTDVSTSFSLADKLPDEFVLVSESGISNPKTVKELRAAGFRGFLIGEHFMRDENPGESLRRFVEAVENKQQ